MTDEVDYTTLRSLRPGEFEDTADGYRTASNMASTAKDRINGQITAKMRQQLKGEAATAALRQLQELSKNFHYSQVECGLVSTTLNALAADLRAAKRKLTAAVEGAEAEKFTVNSDGSVSYPAAGDEVAGERPKGGTVTSSAKTPRSNAPIDPAGDANDAADAIEDQAANLNANPNYGKALEYANRIANAVKEATEADEKWAPKLRKLKADDDLTVSHRDWADAQKDMRGVRKGAEDYLDDIKSPPRGGSPSDNAEWWKGLSQQEKDDYTALRPASVGAMDGLPAEARDEANRTVLAEKRGEYEARLAAIPPEPRRMIPTSEDSILGEKRPNPEWLAWNEKYGEEGTERKHIEDAIKGMDRVEERFNQTGQRGLPEAYLLGFDPEGHGDGKVILANGNPDTADHTASYVPGTGANIGNIDGDLTRGEDLWRESSKQAAGGKIATITWFDYDAPKSAIPGGKGDIIPEAMDSTYATDAGPAFRQFLEGNKTAQENATGEPAHNTALGHSYGSTVIGEAAKAGTFKDDPLAADDIVVAGSPGMQVDRAGDLGIDPNHMWAMAVPSTLDDPTPAAGKYLAGLGDNRTVPTDPEFGGEHHGDRRH